MKRIGFLLSFVFAEIGCICLYLTIILDLTIPEVGKMESQLSDSKRYGELVILFSEVLKKLVLGMHINVWDFAQ